MALLFFNWSKVSKTGASKNESNFIYSNNIPVPGIYKFNVFCNLFPQIILTVDTILPEKVCETQNEYFENESLKKLLVINW